VGEREYLVITARRPADHYVGQRIAVSRELQPSLRTHRIPRIRVVSRAPITYAYSGMCVVTEELKVFWDGNAGKGLLVIGKVSRCLRCNECLDRFGIWRSTLHSNRVRDNIEGSLSWLL